MVGDTAPDDVTEALSEGQLAQALRFLVEVIGAARGEPAQP